MSKHILMIDDDPDFRNAVRTILESEGYRITETGSARRGLEMVLECNPDLILLDVMMEDISAGFRFARHLRDGETEAGKPHVPVIMITSVQELTDLNFQERMGGPLLPVDKFIEKPIEPRVLVEAVGELLKKAA